MPLEIRELHIKVNVSEPAGPGQSHPGSPPPAAQPGAGNDRFQVLAEAVDEVMQILDARKER